MHELGDHQETQHARPTCHVVCIGYSAQDRDLTAICPALPIPVLEEMSRLPAAPHPMATRVAALVRQHRLTGMAVVWNASPFPRPAYDPCPSPYYLSVPPPLEVHFEPRELSEPDGAFSALCADSCDSIQAESCSRLDRWLLGWRRILMAGAGLLLASCLAGPLLGVILLMGLLLWRRWHGAWYIIPGGVVIRRPPLLVGRVRLFRHVPADSVLIITPAPPGWFAHLFSRTRISRRVLTMLEAHMLLRAWTSPLRAPELDELEDLR